jgi:hypothetical protein
VDLHVKSSVSIPKRAMNRMMLVPTTLRGDRRQIIF